MGSNDFTEGILVIDRRVRKESGIVEKCESVEDALSMVLTHIMMNISTEKQYYFIGKAYDYRTAVAVSTFLWHLGHELARFSEPDNSVYDRMVEVCRKAGRATFVTLDDFKDVKKILVEGHDSFIGLLKSSESQANVKKFCENVSKAVFYYGVSKGEELAEIFPKLFNTTLRACEVVSEPTAPSPPSHREYPVVDADAADAGGE